MKGRCHKIKDMIMQGSWLIIYMLWIWLLAVLMQSRNIECCVEAERLALLDIKAFYQTYADYALPTLWPDHPDDGQRHHNCCTWDEVRCNPFGRVTELNLGSALLVSGIPDPPPPYVTFNMTLFRPFTHLTSLDLSFNYINGFFNIQELANLRELQVLDLSYNAIQRLPVEGLCNMMNLRKLILQENNISVNNLSCLGNLISLEYLDLSSNNITGNLPSFGNLTSLQYLDLSDNKLNGTYYLSSLANLSKLNYLKLSKNSLQVQTEDSFWRPTFQLDYVGLENCSLNTPSGTFPTFLSYQYNLSCLDLSHNDLVGAFPAWLLSNNSRLEALYLMNNRLTGYLQLPLANHSLRALGISSNYFHGNIPHNMDSVFPRMAYLNMSSNNFEGHIPTSVGNMTELAVLDLSRNDLCGELPTQLLSCEGMKYIQLSDNNLEGNILFLEQMNFPELYWLKLSNNNFGGTINDAFLHNITFLEYLDISNNKVTGRLPRRIGDLKYLTTLSLSGNLLQGQIPIEICELSELNYLDISQNNFTGPIPSCSNFPNLYYMHLHDNSLTGGVPNDFSNFSSLESLDLRNNHLIDRIPLWIDKLEHLTMLLLGGNYLHGQVPKQVCGLQNLNLLDLSRNKLEGDIPTCLGKVSFGKITIENYLNRIIPGGGMALYFKTMPLYPEDTEVKFLAKNQYLSYKGGNLRLISGLDLSCNNFTGVIPLELGALVDIVSLNLSHNSLYGHIPHTFSDLKQIESLDLSSNNLSGTIPSQLVHLNFLEIFNVSYNNLTGRTIDSGQFSSFDQNSYLGNPGLCGSALNKPCNNLESEVPQPTISPIKQDRGLDMVDFFWSFSMSCGIIFLATIVVLYINRQWRELWFEFVDCHVLSRCAKFKLSLY